MSQPAAPEPDVHTQDRCELCHESLRHSNSNQDHLKASSTINAVQLRCGHRFHWTCMVSYYLSRPIACERCILGRESVYNHFRAFVVTVKKGNGLVGQINFHHEVEHMVYWNTRPEEKIWRIFLGLMFRKKFAQAGRYLKGLMDLSKPPLDPNVTYNVGGKTALHMMAYLGHVEGVRLLLGHGANKRLKTDEGQTALDLAKEAGAEEVIAVLEDWRY
ncbi:MAG: hypothetical protein Q9212_001344 [Teloschistes hypoglaucus]